MMPIVKKADANQTKGLIRLRGTRELYTVEHEINIYKYCGDPKLTDSEFITKLEELGDEKKYQSLDLKNNSLTQFPDLSNSHFKFVRDINLARNDCISTIPDLTHNPFLKYLNLAENGLTELDGSLLPRSIVVLDLGFNNITTMRNLSHLKNLKEFVISGNKISEIPDLSHTKLDELYAGCNPNLTVISGLPNLRFKMNFYKSGSIKILGKNCFYNESFDALMEIVRKYQWELSQPPVEVLNQGFEAVFEYFQEKSVWSKQTSMNLLGSTTSGKSSMMESLIAGFPVSISYKTEVANIDTWDITPLDSIQMFDHGGHNIYSVTTPLLITKNGLIALVHDITKISDSSLEESINIMLSALQYHPGNQTILILTHIDLCETEDEKESNCKHIKGKIDEALDQVILSLSRNNPTDEENFNDPASLFRKQKENMQVFLFSSKTCEGMDDLKCFLEKMIAEKKTNLPEKWVEFYNLFQAKGKKFHKVPELQHDFKQLYSGAMKVFHESKILKKFNSALAYYTDAGHVLHFPDNPVLNEFVFHDKWFVIKVLRSCLIYGLQEAIGSSNKLVQLMVSQFQEEGLLSMWLMKYLWSSYELETNDETTLLEIVKMFNLCYPIDASSDMLFVPCFVKSNQPPSSLNLNKLGTVSKTHFSVQLECVFINQIPVNVFEAMLVRIQKIAVEKKYGGSRQAWHNGIWVKIGTLEIIAVRKPAERIITFCVRGHIDDINEVWKVISDVSIDLDSILHPLCDAMVETYFKCNHCVLRNLASVQKWSKEEVLNSKDSDASERICQEEHIPRALVIAQCKKSQKSQKNLQKYLDSTYGEISAPGKLLYLDCDEVGENQFNLTWCLPSCEEEGAGITHVVVEYRQGETWTKVDEDISETNYRADCSAEEFRVAAVNQSGCGEFTLVTPSRVIRGEEMISDSDLELIKEIRGLFYRMTNVQDVITRLHNRAVISADLKEEIIGQEHAAEHLMKQVIYKTEYGKLHLFQKTLREFGQFVLADLVPVQVEKLGAGE